MSTRTEISLMAVVLAAATLLRLLWLDAVPVGWHHDEALMGIMASEVYRGVQRPIFFTGFLGQEPLYVYLSAGVMWLMGGNQDVLPLRITSALVGIATVGVTYLLGRELLGRRVGIIGSAFLGLSFWQVMLSRDGYRVITQPLLEGATIFLLWRAARHNSIRYYAAAGAALGATFYTYLGARLFPGVLLLFALWWLFVRGWPPARAWAGLGVFVGFAAVVAAPLALFFITNPGTFSARIDQVSVFQPGVGGADPLVALGQNIVKLLATFTVYGETLWRYNISGRPIFVGGAVPLFYVGLIVVIWSAIRGKFRARSAQGNLSKQAAGAMAIAWFSAMLFPSFLSVDVGGYTFRSMGLVPMLYLMPALGAVVLWDWAASRVPRAWRQRTQGAFVGLIAAILLVEAGMTYRDYFVVWADSFGGAYEDMADIVAAARFVEREARPAGEDVFISSDYYRHAVIAHLAPRVYPRARWFDGNSAIVFSPQKARDSLYVFPFSARSERIESLLPVEAMVGRSFFSNGTEDLVAYRLTPAQVETAVNKVLDDPSFTRFRGNLGNEIELLGYRMDPRTQQGDKIEVTAIWRLLENAPAEDRVIFAHLLDVKGAMLAQYDTSAYPSSEWQADDILVERYTVGIDDQVPAGKYSMVVGVYDRKTQARLPVVGAPKMEDTLRLADIKVAASEPADIAPANRLGKNLGEAIDLLGFDLLRPQQSATPRVLGLSLFWQARAVPTEDYTVFVQVLNAEGQLVAQSDGQPAEGSFPTSFWEPGDRILDRHELKLDGGLPPGRYSVIAGMYVLATGKRLLVEGGGDYITLTQLDLR
ncbi:MAG: glycosyltransferase family 39 protein [Chloroflexi bacterium]|nr:glycosyltransferase family 39 protein [Chloroflexota bacterium]